MADKQGSPGTGLTGTAPPIGAPIGAPSNGMNVPMQSGFRGSDVTNAVNNQAGAMNRSGFRGSDVTRAVNAQGALPPQIGTLMKQMSTPMNLSPAGNRGWQGAPTNALAAANGLGIPAGFADYAQKLQQSVGGSGPQVANGSPQTAPVQAAGPNLLGAEFGNPNGGAK